MRKKIYIGLFALFILAVVVKVQFIKLKSAREIISLDSEWLKLGKPVVLKTIKKETLSLFTQVTAIALDNNSKLISVVPQSVFNKVKNAQDCKLSKNDTFAKCKIERLKYFDNETGLYELNFKSLDSKFNLTKDSVYKVEITLGFLDNVFTLPNDTVIMEENSYFVWLSLGNKVKKQIVKLGESNDEYVEITSGLKEGDVVVIEGHNLLDDDSTIRAL